MGKLTALTLNLAMIVMAAHHRTDHNLLDRRYRGGGDLRPCIVRGLDVRRVDRRAIGGSRTEPEVGT